MDLVQIMKKLLLVSAAIAVISVTGLQTAHAASDQIGTRVQNTYDVTLYLDPEKGLAYALNDPKFQRYHIKPRKMKISYAMNSVEANPQSTPSEPVVVEMGGVSDRKLAEMKLSEENQCYEAFTEVLSRLVF